MKRRLLALATCAVTALALVGCGRGKGTEAELLSSARALLDKQDVRGAVIQLKNALQKNPGSAAARLLLGKTLLDSGDPVAALVELTKAQELQVPDEEVVPAIARAMLLTGDESKVVSQFAATQLNKPEAQADLRSTLATAYAGQGNVDQARQTAAEALRIQPGYAPAIILQARLDAAGGDLDGALARRGTVQESVVAAYLDHPYFDTVGPKSLDRFDFSLDLVADLSLEDGAATLTAFAADAVALGLRGLAAVPSRLIVCGGGRSNPVLMRAIAARVPMPVVTAEALGWRGDAIEAEAFAYLAARTVTGLPISFPGTTGVPDAMTGGRLATPRLPVKFRQQRGVDSDPVP